MPAVEHLSNYQARDFEVVDYDTYELSDTGLTFRGPEPSLEYGEYASCLGAAQTFGCLCEQSFPDLLSMDSGIRFLNLGYGGAGPAFFSRQQKLLHIVNRGSFAILQVMSARSVDTSQFHSGGLEWLTRRSDGRKMGARTAWDSVLECRYAWNRLPVGKAVARPVCRFIGRQRVKRLVHEARDQWVADYESLLRKLNVPVILLWFSQRKPQYEPDYSSIDTIFGAFPQLVDRPMIEHIRSLCDDYVDATTDRGMPQQLISRFTGQPVSVDPANDRPDLASGIWTENRYYPSPEMHLDAAAMLAESVARLSASSRVTASTR